MNLSYRDECIFRGEKTGMRQWEAGALLCLEVVRAVRQPFEIEASEHNFFVGI